MKKRYEYEETKYCNTSYNSWRNGSCPDAHSLLKRLFGIVSPSKLLREEL